MSKHPPIPDDGLGLPDLQGAILRACPTMPTRCAASAGITDWGVLRFRPR
jgi:hypothetical protein